MLLLLSQFCLGTNVTDGIFIFVRLDISRLSFYNQYKLFDINRTSLYLLQIQVKESLQNNINKNLLQFC